MIKKAIVVLIIILIPVIIFWCGPNFIARMAIRLAPYTGHWYAFYMDNGEVFYAQIQGTARNWIKLKNVYYLQKITIDGKTQNKINKASANEISLPENYLELNADKILYWEQIGANAEVMKIIKGS